MWHLRPRSCQLYFTLRMPSRLQKCGWAWSKIGAKSTSIIRPQDRHEDLRFPDLARSRINHRHRLTAVVDEHILSRVYELSIYQWVT